MRSAVLNARWHGHALGARVHGRDADKAVAAGRAAFVEPPKRQKITTGRKATSPTREPDRGATTDDDGDTDT